MKFGSCTVLSSSSLWLKHRNLSLYIDQDLESVSDSISVIQVPALSRCTHYIDDLYHMHHWGDGQEFHTIAIAFNHYTSLLVVFVCKLYFSESHERSQGILVNCHL